MNTEGVGCRDKPPGRVTDGAGEHGPRCHRVIVDHGTPDNGYKDPRSLALLPKWDPGAAAVGSATEAATAAAADRAAAAGRAAATAGRPGPGNARLAGNVTRLARNVKYPW